MIKQCDEIAIKKCEIADKVRSMISQYMDGRT